MNCLLDTHTVIWFLNGDNRLSNKVKKIIENPDNSKIVSIASIWEMAIKISLGKLKVENGFIKFLELIENNGFEVFPITFEHAMAVSTLEFIHRDPFDRLIVAQALTDHFTVITKDENIQKYNIETLW